MKQVKTSLINKTEIKVRFSETDPMGVVWHGNYIRYFEDGRESFGQQYNLGYLYYYSQEVYAPIVKVECDYKRPLRYGDTAVIETTYLYTEAAKIIFGYNIFDKEIGDLVAKGKSIQVFVNVNKQLIYTNPSFYLEWQKSLQLITD